jgi:hypothetical protein
MVRRLARLAWFVSTSCLALACGEESSTESTPEPEPSPLAVGSCSYTNPFSNSEECKLYIGATWTLEAAGTDCETGVLGAPGTFTEGGQCDYPATLGSCVVAADTVYEYELVSPGTDSTACESSKMGCEVFAQGVFEPGLTCEGVVGGGGGSASVFVQPYQVCKDPLEGEPVGQGPDGQVCTWTLISASTEEGRRYSDYASCEDVLTQRPYYATAPAGTTSPEDARLDDAVYMAEVDWARQQVEASACICCHSTALAPDGASQWFVEADGIWLDSISDTGIAMMAGLADSRAFGAFDKADNNGFDRTVVGVPTTDNERMRTLFTSEWERRGYSLADAETIPPFGGPLVDQLDYVPSACEAGQGLAPDGTVQWTGGTARYLYILEPSANNPGVPPNLDQPAGTIWFVDVPNTAAPFNTGIKYGELTGDMRKRVPSGAAPALSTGQTYYLYVLSDIGIPVTRCLFTAP